MITPQISQVPIQQPMYANGVMHPVWIRFFERMSNLRNDADLIKLVELAQKVGEQLNSNAALEQYGFELNALLQELRNLPVHVRADTSIIETTLIPSTPILSEDLLPIEQGAVQAQLSFDFHVFQKDMRDFKMEMQTFKTKIDVRVTQLESQISSLELAMVDVLDALSAVNTKYDDLANRVSALESA